MKQGYSKKVFCAVLAAAAATGSGFAAEAKSEIKDVPLQPFGMDTFFWSHLYEIPEEPDESIINYMAEIHGESDFEESAEMEAETETAVETEIETETESETQEWSEETSEDRERKEQNQIIFVGDSRVVGMSMAGGYTYIGKERIGYDWFVSEGINLLQSAMEQSPDASVVLCFGVNDVNNIGSYIAYYQDLMNSYPDKDIWVMSVNPVNDGLASAGGYYITSDMVNQFNASMSQAFPDKYIDCCSYLNQIGFSTGDGVHYDLVTYAMVQEYAKFIISYQ